MKIFLSLAIFSTCFINVMFRSFAVICAFVALLLKCGSSSSRPNIIWFLTDDQDQYLGGSFPEHGGVTPMPKTRDLLASVGATANRFYVHTPICNPSRSELLSGRYFHNIKTTNTSTWEMHVDEAYVNENTFVKDLHDSGYATGMFGKYMNVMPKSVPPGFDAWMANGGGTYISPKFQMYNVENLIPGLKATPNNYGCWNENHRADDKYGCYVGTSDASNYSTAIIGNASLAWIEKTVKGETVPLSSRTLPPKLPTSLSIPRRGTRVIGTKVGRHKSRGLLPGMPPRMPDDSTMATFLASR